MECKVSSLTKKWREDVPHYRRFNSRRMATTVDTEYTYYLDSTCNVAVAQSFRARSSILDLKGGGFM